MPTKEQAEEAKKILEQYHEEINIKFKKEWKCICCKSEIKSVEPYTDALYPDIGMWRGGTVAEIWFGYGSKHDDEGYYIAICDKCITKLEKEGLALNLDTLRKEVEKEL